MLHIQYSAWLVCTAVALTDFSAVAQTSAPTVTEAATSQVVAPAAAEPQKAKALQLHNTLQSQQALQSQKEALGAVIFNDVSLSSPAGQSCATCHNAASAFADPGKAVSEGVVKGAFGNRNVPTLKYAQYSPPLQKEEYADEWRGGQFWDGRVDSLKEQALGPFFNPVEMNSTPTKLAQALRSAAYAPLISAAYGKAVLTDEDALINAAADALEAFQKTPVFAPFDSKYDYYKIDLVKLSKLEERGEMVFNSGGMCIDCHLGRVGERQIFTRFVHHNILVPPNPELPFYQQPATVNPAGKAFVDAGTGNNPKLSEKEKLIAKGMFKTPTLRNIALTAPYMHNGVFKTLEEVVEYYTKMEKFWPPEVNENPSRLMSTSLSISEYDKKALVAFMKTLTDGYDAPPELKAKLRAHQEGLGYWKAVE
ncbi:cytochrome-c peroxidase [Marinagarivorans algicola]|uniref:cytochrome-c peroxidase n=1 Tax=Marinagarivorans algicola TaxID=1513270 RepID=UPI0006B9FEC1|nr:cytochrome c peroxidase [Marinagarivorans algicola]